MTPAYEHRSSSGSAYISPLWHVALWDPAGLRPPRFLGPDKYKTFLKPTLLLLLLMFVLSSPLIKMHIGKEEPMPISGAAPLEGTVVSQWYIHAPATSETGCT